MVKFKTKKRGKNLPDNQTQWKLTEAPTDELINESNVDALK